MSAFTGTQGPGAMRKHRETKKLEAVIRNDMTPLNRKRQWRRSQVDPTGQEPKRSRRGTRGKGKKES